MKVHDFKIQNVLNTIVISVQLSPKPDINVKTRILQRRKSITYLIVEKELIMSIMLMFTTDTCVVRYLYLLCWDHATNGLLSRRAQGGTGQPALGDRENIKIELCSMPEAILKF